MILLFTLAIKSAFAECRRELERLQIFVQRLKNSDFILESKMTELNQNQNSEQPDQPDTV